MLIQLASKCSLPLANRYYASFKKYDYTDGLNFKSLLNEDELIVKMHPYRSSILLVNLHKLISLLASWKITERKNLISQCLNLWERMGSLAAHSHNMEEQDSQKLHMDLLIKKYSAWTAHTDLPLASKARSSFIPSMSSLLPKQSKSICQGWLKESLWDVLDWLSLITAPTLARCQHGQNWKGMSMYSTARRCGSLILP